MACIDYYVCNQCSFEVSLYIKGKRESMLKHHDGRASRELLCANCGESNTFYDENNKICSECNSDQFVGLNSTICPKCKVGVMEKNEDYTVYF